MRALLYLAILALIMATVTVEVLHRPKLPQVVMHDDLCITVWNSKDITCQNHWYQPVGSYVVQVVFEYPEIITK